MANKKELDKYTLDLLVKTIDKVIGRQYTLKQSKTILNQIKRLEASLDVKLNTESTQPSNESTDNSTNNSANNSTDNLCEVLGWKENEVYSLEENDYKIVDNFLYVYQPDASQHWTKTKLQLDDLRNAIKAEIMYCLHIEDLGSYGYLSVADFKSDYERLFINGFKNSYIIKGEFTKDECEYLKQKYKCLSVCDMIPLGWKY